MTAENSADTCSSKVGNIPSWSFSSSPKATTRRFIANNRSKEAFANASEKPRNCSCPGNAVPNKPKTCFGGPPEDKNLRGKDYIEFVRQKISNSGHAYGEEVRLRANCGSVVGTGTVLVSQADSREGKGRLNSVGYSKLLYEYSCTCILVHQPLKNETIKQFVWNSFPKHTDYSVRYWDLQTSMDEGRCRKNSARTIACCRW